MRKICSDRHNTHDATDRNRAGGGVDRGHIIIQIVPIQLIEPLILLRFI